MANRRAFLGGLGIAAMFRVDAFARLGQANSVAGGRPPAEVACDEDYWAEIRRAFDADRTLINLNNGGVCPSPTVVMDAQTRDLRFANAAPAHHMWDLLEPRVEAVRRDLAREFGCDPEEMAITRNASEGMQTLISGIDLERGDEVLATDQNYGRMMVAWDQRARRDGIVVRRISLPAAPASSAAIVDAFRQAMTPRTKVVEVTHVVNLTGAVLPVRAIAAMARERGAATFVDGAHAFAQLPFRRDDLDVDYYAASLHKWLQAPIGTGMLYVRKAKIDTIWPLMAAKPGLDGDIRKFEEIGTHPAANHNAIATALAFHRGIGVERKLARLRYLRSRWAATLAATCPTRASVYPANTEAESSGIGLLVTPGVDPKRLKDHLWEQHRIITSAIMHADFRGLRITPNVDTSLDEIDTFAEAVQKAIPLLI